MNGAARKTNGTLAEHLEAMTNGALVTEVNPEPSSELEALIQEQLQIMAKQIEVLRDASTPTVPEQNGGPGHE